VLKFRRDSIFRVNIFAKLSLKYWRNFRCRNTRYVEQINASFVIKLVSYTDEFVLATYSQLILNAGRKIYWMHVTHLNLYLKDMRLFATLIVIHHLYRTITLPIAINIPSKYALVIDAILVKQEQWYNIFPHSPPPRLAYTGDRNHSYIHLKHSELIEVIPYSKQLPPPPPIPSPPSFLQNYHVTQLISNSSPHYVPQWQKSEEMTKRLSGSAR